MRDDLVNTKDLVCGWIVAGCKMTFYKVQLKSDIQAWYECARWPPAQLDRYAARHNHMKSSHLSSIPMKYYYSLPL